jgi:multidrug efflux system outer membrane protein
MKIKTCLLSLALMISGCIRPHYTPPSIPTPENWRFKSDEGSTLCNLRWWEEFEDPVLNTLILSALKNNQDLRVAIARVFEYRASLGVTNSFLYPHIDASALYSRTKNSLALATTPVFPAIPGLPEEFGLGIPRIFDDFQLFLNLNWELDFWGRLSSASEASYYNLLGQIEARRAVVVTVVSSVATSYIRLRQLDAQLEIAKKTFQSRKESLQLAVYRFEVGETSELEVKQAESELALAAIRTTLLEREIPIQENLLSVILGENSRSIERGSPIGNFRYPIVIPTGLPSDLLARRPDIMQAEDNLIAANAEITKAKALLYPQLNLAGLYGAESNLLENLFKSPANMWQYALSAVEPIFNAGKTIFLIQEAKAVYAELLFQYRQTILKAFREVNDALISYEKDRQLAIEHANQVQVLSEYLRLARLRYLEGEIDYLNVLDAERSLFNAELQHVEAQGDSFAAVVQLYGALGGGWILDSDAVALTPEVFLEDSVE